MASQSFPFRPFGSLCHRGRKGAELTLILRDMAAFFFLTLPLFFTDLISEKAAYMKFFEWALAGAGVVFALRALGPFYGYMAPSQELLYLANSPLVLFAALFLFGKVFEILHKGPALRNLFWAGLAGAALFILLSSMLLDVQRATLGATLLTACALVSVSFVRSPLRSLFPVFVLIVVIFLTLPFLQEAFHSVSLKTAQVGLNMRLQEARAVVTSVSGSFGSVLFGLGWGAEFASPAVGGISVNFTHSLLTYMFLKTGLAGLSLTLIYLGTVFRRLYAVFVEDVSLGFSLLWPLLIPVFLYASHKSLDFGLILLLIYIAGAKPGSSLLSIPAKTAV